MIDQLFEQIGFSKNEIKVYLCLARLGKSSASIIAKQQQLPRSTTYSVLDSLIDRGVVALEHTSGTTYYVINQAESLQRMIEREEQEYLLKASAKKSVTTELMGLIRPFFKSENYSIPKLRFFEGTANVENMLYDLCREWQESISHFDYTWWGYQDNHFVETYRDWLDYYWNSMHQKEKILLLSNKSDTEKKLKGEVARREIKVVPKSFEFSSTIWVLGEYVVTIMTRQKPHYAFQLKDTVFAANQRLMFQLFWKIL